MAQTAVATRAGGQRTLGGTGAMAGGVAAFVALEAVAKWLGGGYPTGQIVFLRTVLAVPGALVLLLAVDGLGGLRPTGLRAHVARGGLMVTAQFAYFAGLQHLALPEATALSFSTPFFVAALSAPLTGERVTAAQWAAVVGGFAGVLVVLRPTPASFEPAGLLILLAAAAYAVALLVTRRYAASQPAGAQVLYSHLVAAAVSSLLVVPGGWTPPASTADLGLFALLGVLGAGNVALITAAFRWAPGAVCAPLYYTAIIWSTLLGWLLWDEHLDVATWAGTAIVVACGLTLVANEHRTSPGNRPHPQSSAHLVNRPTAPKRAAPNLRRRCAHPLPSPAVIPSKERPRPRSFSHG